MVKFDESIDDLFAKIISIDHQFLTISKSIVKYVNCNNSNEKSLQKVCKFAKNEIDSFFNFWLLQVYQDAEILLRLQDWQYQEILKIIKLRNRSVMISIHLRI